MTRLINLQLIETEQGKGKGTESDPYRLVKQLYTPEGKMVLEYDPCKEDAPFVDDLLIHLKWVADVDLHKN